ncbi:neuronal acetylcholine receptor subunit non-alpha-2-like [Babylonia areolata]|uniref:neuronal acetylcholine receptor subunit non-alpha-2-like n=1 Tax=Babylonia areolata TaxID=304850 RepID=UPI003FCFBB3D
MCLSQSALNVSKLHDDLLTLSPHVRPEKDLTRPTVVNVSFHLMSIVSLDIVGQKLVSNGWMGVTWQNDYLTWNPTDYGGVKSIIPPGDRLWRPQLTVENTVKECKPVGEEYVVMHVYNSGLVAWFPAERFETMCKVSVTFFPFDIQRCTWQLFVWGDNAETVVLQAVNRHIDLELYQENGEWNLIASNAWMERKGPDAFQFLYLTYEATLRRRPTLLFLTVLLPICTLSFVNVFVLTIPSESGERLAYAMTSFMSFGVNMSYMVDLIPFSPHTVSILAIILACQLIGSGLYVLLCILSLQLFHRDPHNHPIPPTLQTLTIGLELLLCLDPPPQPRHVVHTEVEEVSSDSPGDPQGTEVKGSRLQGLLTRCARKRKVRGEEYTQDMTWQRVSRSLDKLLFRFFFSVSLIAGLSFITVMACYYYGSRQVGRQRVRPASHVWSNSIKVPQG